jgi:hypothetical protein
MPATSVSYWADAPGFDRAVFHAKFNAKVVRFFPTDLGNPSPPE